MTKAGSDNQHVIWRDSSQWRGYLAARYPGVEVVVRPAPMSFRAQYRAWNFGGIEFAEIRTTAPQRLFIAQPGRASPESYYLPLQLRGSFQGGQFERECSSTQRTMMLLDSTAPHWREVSADSHLLNVRLPAAMLERYLIDPTKFCVSALRADAGRAALVWDFLMSLWRRRGELGAADHALADTMAQMIAELFAAQSIEPEARRADLSRRDLLQYVMEHIADADLNVELAARACGISPRYVHILMQQTGRTFTQYVLEQRLHRSRRALSNYDASMCSITNIAFDCGFNDVSHFSRTFRRCFGVSPREYRRRQGD